MKVTRITRHPRLDRVRVHVDGEDPPRLELAVDLLLDAGIAVGDTLDDARLEHLAREDEAHRATEAAVRLLAHRARTRAEIERRLDQRGFSEDARQRTLEWLDERGYLDDAAFAEAWVRDRVRLRPRGRLALVRELARKGVDRDVAEAAARNVLEGEGRTEADLAIRIAREWARRNPGLVAGAASQGSDRARARRRLYAHLSRRGFPPDAVRAALEDALGD